MLRWAQLQWTDDDPETARYACEACGALIEERFKAQMLAQGEWIAGRPAEERVQGFHLSSLYSPHGWVRWADLVREFLAANVAAKRGDVSLLRVFVNTRLAETFEEGTAPASELAAHALDYPLGTCPDGVLALTAGVDVQADRIEAYVWGFGRDDRMWLVDFRAFYGPPETRDPWTELGAFLDIPIDGLRVLACGVDTGFSTAMAYTFAARRKHCFALKGSALASQPILGRPLRSSAPRSRSWERGSTRWASTRRRR